MNVNAAIVALIAIVGACSLEALGQGGQDNGGRRTVVAVPLPERELVTLDGRLDEPFWSTPVPAADFVQIEPANGSPQQDRDDVEH